MGPQKWIDEGTHITFSGQVFLDEVTNQAILRLHVGPALGSMTAQPDSLRKLAAVQQMDVPSVSSAEFPNSWTLQPAPPSAHLALTDGCYRIFTCSRVDAVIPPSSAGLALHGIAAGSQIVAYCQDEHDASHVHGMVAKAIMDSFGTPDLVEWQIVRSHSFAVYVRLLVDLDGLQSASIVSRLASCGAGATSVSIFDQQTGRPHLCARPTVRTCVRTKCCCTIRVTVGAYQNYGSASCAGLSTDPMWRVAKDIPVVTTIRRALWDSTFLEKMEMSGEILVVHLDPNSSSRPSLTAHTLHAREASRMVQLHWQSILLSHRSVCCAARSVLFIIGKNFMAAALRVCARPYIGGRLVELDVLSPSHCP